MHDQGTLNLATVLVFPLEGYEVPPRNCTLPNPLKSGISLFRIYEQSLSNPL
jgi:hypothetical protein